MLMLFEFARSQRGHSASAFACRVRSTRVPTTGCRRRLSFAAMRHGIGANSVKVRMVARAREGGKAGHSWTGHSLLHIRSKFTAAEDEPKISQDCADESHSRIRMLSACCCGALEGDATS